MTPLDKARRCRLGLAGYVAVLAAMPASNPQIARKIGRSAQRVAAAVRDMRKLGVVGQVGEDRSTPRGVAPVWAVGDWPRERMGANPRPQAIAFASMVRSMRERPRSVSDLAEETGLDMASIRRVIKALRGAGLSHIATWRARHGSPIALHGFGPGADAEPPQALEKTEINARYRARRAVERRRRERIASIPCSVFALGAC